VYTEVKKMEVDEEDLDFVASVAEIMIISVFFYRKTVKIFQVLA